MIIETTNYYALPGRAADVLQQRRLVTRLRVTLGLPPGRIFVRKEGAGPDVRWECEYDNEAAYQADMQARAANPEFAAGRKHMHELLERFERHVEVHVPD